MNRAVLLATAGFGLGVVLAVTGTVFLGRARAVAKHSGADRRAGADLAQYVAGFTALVGFLAVAGAGAVATLSLLPLAGTLRLAATVVTGVVLFAVIGTVSARVANRVEENRAVALRPVRTSPSTGPYRAVHTRPPPQTIRPGWVYQDQAGAWYMGITAPSGDPQLLELPGFSLVGSRQPAYPLHPAGAGELAVVPLADAEDVGSLPGADGDDPDSS